MLMCSTSPRPLSRRTRRTLPRLPFSLPATTMIVSPFRTCACAMPSSDHFRSERDDLGELPVAQLARHRSEDARAHGIVIGLDEHHRVAVEADVGAVPPPHFLDRAYHHRARHLALLHRPVGDRLLHRHDDDVDEGGVALVGAAEDSDTLCVIGALVDLYV